MNKLISLSFLILFFTKSIAQTDSSATQEIDFDSFGDVDTKEVKNYCTQKVTNLSPTKLISIGYESTGGFHAYTTDKSLGEHVNSAGGLRFSINAPVISKSSAILNLGLNYWNTQFNYKSATPKYEYSRFQTLNSLGLNATLFKPLSTKNFFILQASADFNDNNKWLPSIKADRLTVSGTAIYGWKKSDYFMWGLGISRTYRAGQLLHIPVILYNKTFNNKTGIEAVFPAKLNFRYNFSVNSLIMLGYEIEGNAYAIGQNLLSSKFPDNDFVRRGELRPRITFEKQLKNFIWLSAQVGVRQNWRFNTHTTINPQSDNEPLASYKMGSPVYFNLSLNLVSP
jgi:Domain of unknown function (DUF6268)